MVFALFAVCVLLTVYGVWSLAVLSRTGELVVGAYDSPSEAIINAQAAQVKFNEARLRRLGLDRDIYSEDMSEAAADLIVELSLEKLNAADTLSRSDESRKAVQEVKKSIGKWRRSELSEEREKAAKIAALFDAVYNAAASDSVAARRSAHEGVNHYFKISTLSFSASLLIAIIFACLFGLEQTRHRAEKADLAAEPKQAARSRRAKLRPAEASSAPAQSPEPVQLMQRRIQTVMARDRAQPERPEPSGQRR